MWLMCSRRNLLLEKTIRVLYLRTKSPILCFCTGFFCPIFEILSLQFDQLVRWRVTDGWTQSTSNQGSIWIHSVKVIPLFHMRISKSSVVDVPHFKPITIPQKLSCSLTNEKCTECSAPLVPYAFIEKRVPYVRSLLCIAIFKCGILYFSSPIKTFTALHSETIRGNEEVWWKSWKEFSSKTLQFVL